MNPVIRVAELGDVEVLAGLNGEVQDLHYAQRPDQFKPTDRDAIAAWFRPLLESPSARIWIAELDGTPVGYVAVRVCEKPENPFCPARTWWELDQIGVRAAHRRKGIGRALVRHVLSHARAEGIRVVELSSWAFNEDAHHAFHSFGFVPKHTRYELHLPDPEADPTSSDR